MDPGVRGSFKSYCVLAGLELTLLLPQFLEGFNYRYVCTTYPAMGTDSFLCLFVCVGRQYPCAIAEVREQLGKSQLSCSSICVFGIKLRSSGLAATTFTH